MPYYFFSESEDGKTVYTSKDYASTDRLVKERLPEVLEAFQKGCEETEDIALQKIYEMVNEAAEDDGPCLIYDTQSWCEGGWNEKLYPDINRIYIVKF
jgi:hypothetical protein